MSAGKKVAVLIKEKDRQYEGLRSSLGLLLEKHVVSMFVLGHEVTMTEEYQDNMGFINEIRQLKESSMEDFNELVELAAAELGVTPEF